MRDTKYKLRYLNGLSWLVVAVFSLTGCRVPPYPTPVKIPAPAPAEPNIIKIPAPVPAEPNVIGIPAPAPAEPNFIEIPKAVLTDPNIFGVIYELIEQGKFNAAGELIRYWQLQLCRLADIVQEYKNISQRRQSARETAYKEKLAELEKFQVKAKADTNPAPSEGAGTGDVNDVNSVNDANNISEVLAVIARAREFVDDQQKDELLSRPYVKQTIQKAIDKAAAYESQGKWLDAYITCYSWLGAIEPNNEQIADYAEKLVEKAGIAASFQDSPCETREERFQGVKKDIFVWAIEHLKANYIDIIDYKQMATAGLKRCQLLGEVMQFSTGYFRMPQIESGAENQKSKIKNQKSFAAWSAALAAVSAEVEQSPTGFGNDEFVAVFEKVLKLNETTVELPRPVLIAQFAEAAFSTLDPHTVIVWPRQMQSFQKMMTNEFTGIGIEITKQKGLLTIASLLPDTPAYNSGLDAGDVIEKVDGVQTKDMTLICAVHKITGPKGTKVTLTIRRAGEEETKDITITRARITVPTVRGWQRTEVGKWRYIIDEQDKIGYIQLTSFSEKTSTDLEELLRKLEAEGLKGLILDLRFNSGGLLDSAVAVTDKFLKEGLIVRTDRGFGRGLVFEAAHKKNTHPNYPLVILTNSSSASASEIVAGALADEEHNRAILVGERTHGKGSVQGIVYYRQGGAQLKYTMAYYHLPSGQRVESREAMKKQGREDWGVGPDIKVKLRSDELKKLIEVQRDNDVLVKADHDSTRHELKKHTIKETLAADPQLAIGLLVIKSKLIEAKTRLEAPERAQELTRAG